MSNIVFLHTADTQTIYTKPIT